MAPLNVELEALVTHASKRYEDAYICDALRYFIGWAGDVPAFAWGKMPWSSRWATSWHSAVECRIQEAGIARDLHGDTGATLYKVAANYAHADISSAVRFDDIAAQNDFFLPWLNASTSPGTVVAHPGGGPSGPTYASGPVRPKLTPSDVSDPHDLHARVTLASHDHLIGSGWFRNPGEVTPADKTLNYLGATDGRKRLHQFVDENGGAIEQAEAIVRQLGLVQGKLPMQDFINEALPAFPGVIENRAELLNAVSNEWGERGANMTSQTIGLQAYWDSPGAAAAYFHHANRCIRYYDTLKAQAAWLGMEGKKAAEAIDSLQLAYEKAGRSHIGNLITRLKAYLDAADSFTGSIEEPGKALADVLFAMASAMLTDWQAANDDASAMLEISQEALDKAPDLGDATHRAHPFPSESGAAPYCDAGDWKPNRSGAPRITSAT